MSDLSTVPESLHTSIEARVYRAVKAAQAGDPSQLHSEFEKQVFNALIAAGFTSGGGDDDMTEMTPEGVELSTNVTMAPVILVEKGGAAPENAALRLEVEDFQQENQ